VSHPTRKDLMHLYQRLQSETTTDRDFLLSAPAIQRALRGDITLPLYVEFLTQAYHHVRHTVPLMMAVGARASADRRWLQDAILHYLDEEAGHDLWILDDIAHAGGDRDAAAASRPAIATEAMVAYAYDTVTRGHPAGFFGMVYVLEGTSAALALQAADRIQGALGLPTNSLSYLRSHGQLDQEHVGDLEQILGRLTDPAEQEAVIRCARGIFWLYGQMFRGLEAVERTSAETPGLRRTA
jgi:pyrroloquinoline quinone (PQQ) biosynthesis protein C